MRAKRIGAKKIQIAPFSSRKSNPIHLVQLICPHLSRNVFSNSYKNCILSVGYQKLQIKRVIRFIMIGESCVGKIMYRTQIYIMLLFGISINGYSREIQCKSWQTYVKEHTVKSYVKKDGTRLKQTIRKAHCREKWKYADKWGPLFQNTKPDYWPQSKEDFKKWSSQEKEFIFQELSEIPLIHHYRVNSILRAKKSKDKKNPASSIPETKDIVLYDLYFDSKDTKEILTHEMAHIIAHQIETKYISIFAEKSGWKLEINKRQVYEVPPTKLIKKDSSFSIEEDFCNYFEIYVTNPEKIKKFNLDIYNLLKQRFPL